MTPRQEIMRKIFDVFVECEVDGSTMAQLLAIDALTMIVEHERGNAFVQGRENCAAHHTPESTSETEPGAIVFLNSDE